VGVALIWQKPATAGPASIAASDQGSSAGAASTAVDPETQQKEQQIRMVYLTPISIYGKVVDQNRNPISKRASKK
jgi:hypothetical protein